MIDTGRIVPGSIEPLGETTPEIDEIGREVWGERYDKLHGIGGAVARENIKTIYHAMLKLGYRREPNPPA